MTSLGTGFAPIALKPRRVRRSSVRGRTVSHDDDTSLDVDIGGSTHANIRALPGQKQGYLQAGEAPVRTIFLSGPTSCFGPQRDARQGDAFVRRQCPGPAAPRRSAPPSSGLTRTSLPLGTAQ
jgi:hypothetical protein